MSNWRKRVETAADVTHSYVAIALVALTLAVSACSSSAPEARDTSQLVIDNSVLLDYARSGGASDEQIELLEKALAANELSYDDLYEQFLLEVACLESAGLAVEITSPEEIYPEVLIPTYRYPMPKWLTYEQESKISVECHNRHLGYVSSFYVGQPVAIEAYLGTFEVQREYILDCLAERGITLDADATPTELLYAVSEETASEAGRERPACYQGSTFQGFVPD